MGSLPKLTLGRKIQLAISRRVRAPQSGKDPTNWLNCCLLMTGHVEKDLHLNLYRPFATAIPFRVNREVASKPLSWHPFARCANFARKGRAARRRELHLTAPSADGGKWGITQRTFKP